MRKIFCGFMVLIATSSASYAQSFSNDKDVQCFAFTYSALQTLKEYIDKGTNKLAIQPVTALYLNLSDQHKAAMDSKAAKKDLSSSEINAAVNAGLKKHNAYLEKFAPKSSDDMDNMRDLDIYMGKRYKSLGCK